MQHEPGMAAPLTDPAVGHDLVLGRKSLLRKVNRLQLGPRLKRPVLIRRARPRDRLGARDVPAAHRALLRVVRHMQQFPGVLPRRPDVDQRLAEVGEHVLLEGPDRRVVSLDHGVCRLPRRGATSRIAVGSSRPSAIRASSRSTTGYAASPVAGATSGIAVVSSRPSAIHLARPPSSSLAFSCPKRLSTHSA